MFGIIGVIKGATKGDVLRYLFMPQVMPRIRGFYQDGFAHLAYMIALVYRAVNILPADHEILKPGARHHLGIRQVLAAAGAELRFTRDNIDKTVIYFVILSGLVMLAIQFFIMLGYFMVNPAFAQTTAPESYGEFFATPVYPDGKGGGDVAYNLLFSVFGVPDLFKPGGARSEFHVALHSLFQFYSIGLLVVAVIIVCYFIFAILVETAQTGVPFGKRYNHVWTPMRLVFALGLLIPIGYGLNAAQWITLYSAKFGSDFATEGWIRFNNVMTDAYLKEPEERVATPQAPDLMPFVGYMMTVKACEFAYEKLYEGKKDINAYLVKDGGSAATPFLSKLYDGSREYFDQGDIVIRFGEYNRSVHTKERGFVRPYCGEIVIRSSDTPKREKDGSGTDGSSLIQAFYYTQIRGMYQAGVYDVDKWGQNMIQKYSADPLLRDEKKEEPPADYKATTAIDLDKKVKDAIERAVKAQAQSGEWEKDADKQKELGWGGAGIWYNKIAQINGALVTAVQNTPQIRLKPEPLEYIEQKQLQENQNHVDPSSTALSNNQEIPFDDNVTRTIAEPLTRVYGYWSKEGTRQDALGNQTRETNNILIDTINLIFGTRGLFDMCASADVHPLAQLSSLGKGLIEASIRNLALAFATGIGGAILPSFIGVALGAASSILLSIASITITMGFMLFYVLPFMPFLYFFFAVGGWIKGLFEAMVGVPLWALAHLRIDGEGLPGDAAMDGIYLIFEIFIRPILIVFGLLASVVIFAAMVKILNDIFALVVVNLAGHDPETTSVCGKSGGGGGGGAGGGGTTISSMRGPIDELFFTVMYAIIVYMIGMSCFKLIDLVPNNILRYMGARVNTYNDTANDPADGLMFRLSAATSMVSNKVVGGAGSIIGQGFSTVTQGAKGIGEIAGAAGKQGEAP